jgi:DNA-binding winged helix-turn-helix (wHTH) protein
MLRRRAPWWVYVMGASFGLYFTLFTYVQFRGPEHMGTSDQLDRSRGEWVVTRVLADTPASRAGLRAGDRWRAINGRPVRNDWDWWTVFVNLRVGETQELEVERWGWFNVPLHYQQMSWTSYGSVFGKAQIALLIGLLVTLVLGLVIAFKRPDDPVSRVGALFLAGAAIAGLQWPPGVAVVWRHWPVWLSALLWIPVVTDLARAQLTLTFFALFPRKLFQARWIWVVIWAPLALFLPWLYYAARVIYHPERMTVIPSWTPGIYPYTNNLYDVAYLAGGLLLLFKNYSRLEDLNERRRVRVLVAGALIGLGAVTVGLAWVSAPERIARLYYVEPIPALITGLYLFFPVCFAYSVLRHRLFDVRIIIRQGLQYAAARGFLLSPIPALAVILLGDSLAHPHAPLATILYSRGWLYAAGAGVALLAHWRRRHWMDSLDRRFFRERYDAHRLLRQVAEGLRAAGEWERAAPFVVTQIEAALHPETVMLLTQDPGERSYRCVSAIPSGQQLPPLPADSKLVSVVRLMGRPLNVTQEEAGWLEEQLPPGELDYLRQSRLDLLVPVVMTPARRQVLLALGTKRSEEPYSREDQDLLMAIAASLALVMERPAGAAAAERLWFDDFEVDLRAGELRRKGVRVRLPQQSFQILAMLLERAGEVVMREEIQQRLWPDDTIVEFENSINAAVKRLRMALGDSATQPRYVETLARRGYRFIAPVRGGTDPGAANASPPMASLPDGAHPVAPPAAAKLEGLDGRKR